jgi:hypothetical protein
MYSSTTRPSPSRGGLRCLAAAPDAHASHALGHDNRRRVPQRSDALRATDQANARRQHPRSPTHPPPQVSLHGFPAVAIERNSCEPQARWTSRRRCSRCSKRATTTTRASSTSPPCRVRALPEKGHSTWGDPESGCQKVVAHLRAPAPLHPRPLARSPRPRTPSPPHRHPNTLSLSLSHTHTLTPPCPHNTPPNTPVPSQQPP